MSVEISKTASHTNDPLMKAISAGHVAILVTGNIHDFTLVGDEIAYRPELILDQLYDQGYIVIRYSKSQGGRIHRYSSLNPKDKQAVDSRLNVIGILPLLNKDGHNTPEEIRSFFRSVSRLLQLPVNEAKPVAVVIDYSEHLAPAVQTSAAAADEHTFVAESLHILANAPALRKSKNILICFVRDGLQNALLNDMHRVEYTFPDETQTKAFILNILNRSDANGKPQYGPLEKGLTEQDFARLTRGLRLRDVEAMLREARAENVPLSRNLMLEAKAASILRASESTLSVMSTNLTLDDIVGLEVVKGIFTIMSQKLKTGDPTSPRSVLMVGPPGTSKSSFAPILAAICGFNILQFQNVKNMYVGESERRLRLALSLVETLAPSILFIDEITEAIPNRDARGDSGVSLDLLGQLFKFSARDDLRGKVLLLGASNVPERLDPAWHDRFIFVPFLELMPQEICLLFGTFQRRMTGKDTLNPQDPKLIESASTLHSKGASPRKILDIINHALLFSANGDLNADDILAASKDYVGSANPMAVAYTSLVAISLTSFQSFLPWSLDPENYIYPWYLEGIVDKKTGEIDREKLHKQIQEYRKYTNL
jgi:SpoVK/Ycf46/Vps4 family AAA+-type ATPase